MKHEVTNADGFPVVKLLGSRLDAPSAPALKELLVSLVDAGEPVIVVEMQNVEFIDSTGLGVLVSTVKKLGADGEIVVCGVRETVADLFKLMRMDRVFKMVANLEDAKAVLEK